MPDTLTLDEQKRVEELLRVKFKYIDHPLFHPPIKAERELFKEGIPEPETDWYLTLLNAKDRLMNWNDVSNSKRNIILTREQEQLMFLRFNFAKYKFINQSHYVRGGFVTPNSSRKLIKWHDLAIKLRQQIAEVNLAIVLSMVNKHRQYSDYSDLLSAGNESLMIAIEGFDVSMGYKFVTYAWQAIRRCVLRERKNASRRNDVFPHSLHPEIEAMDEKINNTVERDEVVEIVQNMIKKNLACLNSREMKVIRFRFFEKKANGHRYTFEELGKILNVSRTSIQLAQESALKKLREAWQEHID